MSEPIKPLVDNFALPMEQREQLNKINEVIERTNEITRVIEAMPDYPLIVTTHLTGS